MAYIGNNGFTSTNNSTTTPLDSTATYTGVAELNSFPDVMVQVETDLDGTLYCEFSPDGTNWDTSLSFVFDTSRINPPHIFVKGSRYFRVRFINSETSTQSYLRLYTYYGNFQKLTSPINGTLSENYDAIVTRPSDYNSEVAMSKRQGRTLWNKFGYNDDIDSSSAEIIASFGGTFNIMTSADTLDIESTSGADAAAGTGCSYMLITGIDENYLHQEEYVTLTGLATVTTSNQWLGVNRMIAITTGSNDANVGTISASDTSGTFGIQAQIPIDNSVTQQCIFHTQINHNFLTNWLLLGALKLSGGSSPRVTFKGFSYSRVTDTVYEVFRMNMDTSVENHVELTPSHPFVIGGREVFYLTADTNTNNTETKARFSGIEERIS